MSFINTFQKMSVNDLRTEVVSLLQEAYADGRIGVDSLERRLKDATEAGDKEELMALVSDIPAPAEKKGEKSSGRREERPWRINDRIPRESQTFFAILGGSHKIGRWQPARQISCLSLMGGIKLDFREAEFPLEGVHVNAGCIMGGLEIIVPPGINVEIGGIPLLGGMENKAGSGDSDAPTVTVRGLAIMGGMEIRRKEPKRDRKRRRPGRSRRTGS